MSRWPFGSRRCSVVLAALAVAVAAVALGKLFTQPDVVPGGLLAPTGLRSVGRISYHWANDPAVPAVGGGDARCEVMVHLWYPAKPSTTKPTAPYIPSFTSLQDAVGAEHLRDAAGPAYEALSTARTHAIADAQLDSDAIKFPIVLLTHGLRFNALGYTMLGEDLASHGYVVVGVDHPATAFAVLYPDKRMTQFDETSWNEPRTAEEKAAFERRQVEQCARDLRFVVDQLQRLDSGELPGPFQGRLDLARIGAFGHSFGGRTVARACQLDSRIKVGIICDGFGRRMTVDLQSDGSTVRQPMMVQYARRVPPSGWTRAYARMQTPGSDLEAELRAARADFCRRVVGGSYEVVFNGPGIAHESFTDMPLLESGQSPETHRHRKRAIELTRSFTRAFFDRHLCDRPAPLLDDIPFAPAEAELIRHVFAPR